MKFTESHEWIKVEDGIGVVGITAHAQRELGEVVYIELPLLGKTVAGGQEIAVLESTKAAADVYAPVSGEIIAVNEALRGDSQQINTSPESDGWLFKIKLATPSELDSLLDHPSYLSLIN